ncbi:hypothetical protein [Streptomyces sp. NPDC058701]|uniref:hypothetical protein n=1 Tax=Streptomyces sp. NPDC058701 TaxID=3346608 RepID=UPI003668303B
MKGEQPGESNPAQQWVDGVLAHLHACDDVDLTVTSVAHGSEGLTAETDLRRGRAVYAAAMGLGPAGCAVEAGITEVMLARWRQRDAEFDRAMEAAASMARAGGVAPTGRLNGVGLRILLRSLTRGVPLGAAAEVAGLRRDQLNRLRRRNPSIHLLVEAAVAHSRERPKPPRGKRAFVYRLVTTQPPAPGGAKPRGPGADASGP